MSNRMTEQTKEWVIEALFELLQTEELSHITVQEICDCAQISRKTFYRRFRSKNDVLKLFYQKKIIEYKKAVKMVPLKNFIDLIRFFFDFWDKSKNELIILQNRNLLFNLQNEYNSQAKSIYSVTDFPWHLENKKSNELKISLLMYWSIGGLWNIVSIWLKDYPNKSSQEIANLLIEALLETSKLTS
ncbi:TetR/AcrR family transcriptional regulator [Lactobacillus mellis]|uniref:TetR/AcrR family transcriptional regulator n=1 Tax=Bombilactobacillus mellis TaxID=1218508 RepID=UPI0015812944|nr:TetR/AcrR family transcriptional regulator [Bombilactobacillus mellis]NUG38682.1 TetR/AcrR family transcriptional regulator [Bombilactobacillus mellis]